MLRIEPAGLHDLPGAYRVCLLTGDAGRDASALHGDPDLLGHVYVGAYLVQGAGTQLVVVDGEGVAGYLLSADDTAAFEDWAEAHWWPPLRARYPRRDDGSRDAELIHLVHEPPRARREVVLDHPAHLHVDLVERARGLGLGRVLIERVLSELDARGVAGVHLGVDPGNAHAIGFYRHLGFRELLHLPDELVMGRRAGG
jgi:ribosomal protein S18 acetylase RimI-like enzyme